MGRGGHDLGAVFPRCLDHQPSRRRQRLAQIGYRVAHPGIGLDLSAQKLVHHPVGPGTLGAGFEYAGVRVVQQVSGGRVDEEELLFDAQGDGGGCIGVLLVHSTVSNGPPAR